MASGSGIRSMEEMQQLPRRARFANRVFLVFERWVKTVVHGEPFDTEERYFFSVRAAIDWATASAARANASSACAVRAVSVAPPGGANFDARAVRLDFATILQKSTSATLNIPFSQDLFGPMWPNGAPPGWQSESTAVDDPSNPLFVGGNLLLDSVLSLRLTAEVGEYFDAEVAIDGLVGLDEVLNQISINLCGYGLKLNRGESFGGERIGEGVLQ